MVEAEEEANAAKEKKMVSKLKEVILNKVPSDNEFTLATDANETQNLVMMRMRKY